MKSQSRPRCKDEGNMINPYLNIVERMETTMDELKDLLPKKYPLRSVIYEIPRNLVESQPSAAQMSADLRVFKDYLPISDEIEGLKVGADSRCLISRILF
jgi:hypothetical protein